MSTVDRVEAIERSLNASLARYSFALLATIIAAVAQFTLSAALAATPPVFLLFYPCVMLVSLGAGFGPGLFATLLATGIAKWVFVEPVHSFAVRDRGELVVLATFAIIGTAISLLGDLFRRRAQRLTEFEKTVEGLEEMIVVVDRNYRYLIANRAYLNYRGARREDIIGRTVAESVTQEVFDATVKNNLDRCFLGEIVQFEMRHSYPHREPCDLAISYFPIDGAAGIDRVACVIRDITQRKKAESALRDSEDRYRDLVEHTQELICTHNLEGRLLSVNPAAARLLGYSPADLLEIPMRELIPFEFRQQFDEYLDRMKTKGRDHGWLSVITKKGESRLWEYNNTLRTDGVEMPIVRGMARDVTEVKTAERALRNSEGRYRTLFERSAAGVAIVAKSGYLIDCNDAWAHMFGHNTAAQCHGGQTQACYVDVADREVLMRELESHGLYVNREVQLRKRDGSAFWGLVSGTLIPQGSAEPLIQTSIIDITERREAEEHLRESQHRLTGIIASAMDAIITVDDEQHVVLFNDAAEKMFRCSRQEALGRTIGHFIPERFRAMHQVHVRSFAKSGTTNRGMGSLDSLWAVRSNGDEFPMEASISRLEAGGKKLLTVIIRDITDRLVSEANQKLSEEALRKSEERFSKAFRNNPMAITLTTTEEGRYLDVNDAFLEMVGLTRSEIIGHTSKEIRFWGESVDRLQFLEELKEKGQVSKHHANYRTAKGEVREAEIWAESIELDEKPCILAIARDVTEIQMLEAQFRQAQKMEAVGRLAGGVAHDFNNLLGVILGYCDISNELVQADSQAGRYLSQIKKAAQRAALLTRQLLAFSRKQVTFPRVLDLNEVVRNALHMFLRVVGEDIAIEFRPAVGLGHIHSDPGQIEQVLMNLVVNARDAMPAGGKILIETADVEIDDHYVGLHSGSKAGRYVSLIVSDNGCGMDEAIKSKIFDPFFTTKGVGKGTGLGLSTVYGIVKQSEGYIAVYSEPGEGTSFKIYFPLVRAEASALEIKSEDIQPPRGSESILLVEDDQNLRTITRKLLEDGGYGVHEARDVDDALRILADSATKIDLLLTDVIMPGKNGTELAKEAKDKRDDIRCMFMSGYSETLVERQEMLEEATFLEKPFTRKALLTKVYSILHRHSSGRKSEQS